MERDPSDTTLVCPHVIEDMRKAAFICCVQDGYLVACSETCSSLSTGEGLGMAHLSHFEDLPDLPDDALRLPVNACVRREGNNWFFEFFEDDSDPQEGEFRLADISGFSPSLSSESPVQVIMLRDGTAVSATLDEGFRVLPVWRCGTEIPRDFVGRLASTETVVEFQLNDVFGHARRSAIRYLAIDFLCNQVDFGILVPDKGKDGANLQ
ncbi:hypothetical protein [Tateyamaria sp. SN3-11]|uniref:hypothetical protein n=1 Tax=Tateyamaria sp. SN3-11 TaxID=3092147 RepID=UPI0039EC01F0